MLGRLFIYLYPFTHLPINSIFSSLWIIRVDTTSRRSIGLSFGASEDAATIATRRTGLSVTTHHVRLRDVGRKTSIRTTVYSIPRVWATLSSMRRVLVPTSDKTCAPPRSTGACATAILADWNSSPSSPCRRTRSFAIGMVLDGGRPAV